MSSFGSPTVETPERTIASSYHSGSESRTACSSTASRPIRWITIGPGTLPLRKPGIRSSRPSCAAVRWRRDSISSLGHLGVEAHARVGQLCDWSS